MALSTLLSLSLSPSLSLKPRSFAIRRPLPSVHLLPRSVQLIALVSSNSDIGRVIEFEQSDPTIEVTTGGISGGNNNINGGDGGGGRGDGPDGEEEEEGKKKKGGMLMSQKLTIVYAALVAAGGLMGFFKSGSQKSLLFGGLSALVLAVVYNLLPVFPTVASVLGLGISGALMLVMGTRFRKSGKVFPAGIVALISLIMTAGYGHGILRQH